MEHRRVMHLAAGLAGLALGALMLSGCDPEPAAKPKYDVNFERPDDGSIASRSAVEVPAFNADSAYAYVAAQVAFGPRVPNTPEHAATVLASVDHCHRAEVSFACQTDGFHWVQVGVSSVALPEVAESA